MTNFFALYLGHSCQPEPGGPNANGGRASRVEMPFQNACFVGSLGGMPSTGSASCTEPG